MSLFNRLCGEEGYDKIGLDGYIAAANEQVRGQINAATVYGYFDITGSDQDDHDDVIARMSAILLPLQDEVMRDTMVLCEQGYRYTTASELKTRWGIS